MGRHDFVDFSNVAMMPLILLLASTESSIMRLAHCTERVQLCGADADSSLHVHRLVPSGHP
eukprot:2557241-Amphidinium_carterae.1